MRQHISHRHIARVLFILIVIGLAWMRVRHIQHPRKQRDAPYGRYTDQQILTQAQGLCSQLAPPGTTLQLTAEPLTIPSRFNAPMRVWDVYGQDRNRHDAIIFLRWNADTNELLIVASMFPPGDVVPQRLDRTAVISNARHWLERLGFGSAKTWRMAEPPQMSSAGTWSMKVVHDRQSIHVVIDGATGALLTAMRGIEPQAQY